MPDQARHDGRKLFGIFELRQNLDGKGYKERWSEYDYENEDDSSNADPRNAQRATRNAYREPGKPQSTTLKLWAADAW